MSVWLTVFTSLAAAVIGGVISPQLAQTKERRLARAAVREKLGEVDALRWEDKPYQDFRRAVIALESAAIMAGLPRPFVERYIAAAQAAREASQTFDEGPDDEPITVLPDLAKEEELQAALAGVSRLLWHPWIGRLDGKRKRATSRSSTSW